MLRRLRIWTSCMRRWPAFSVQSIKATCLQFLALLPLDLIRAFSAKISTSTSSKTTSRAENLHGAEATSPHWKASQHAQQATYSKTCMKQLFAGRVGLPILAICFGLSVGIPLDSSSSSRGATSTLEVSLPKSFI